MIEIHNCFNCEYSDLRSAEEPCNTCLLAHEKYALWTSNEEKDKESKDHV